MRKVYLLPNFVTTINMLCGFYSIHLSARGDWEQAAWMIILAGVFDMLDGRIARLAKATSSFGVEYDSLSDLVSFGVAPAFLLVHGALEPLGRLGLGLAFLYLTAGALRLARFNVLSGGAEKSYFQGLPIPAAAGMVASSFLFEAQFSSFTSTQWTWLGAVEAGVLGLLMISSIPFPSFKEVNWRSSVGARALAILIGLFVLIWLAPEATLFLIGSFFILGSLGWNGIKLLKRKQPNVGKLGS